MVLKKQSRRISLTLFFSKLEANRVKEVLEPFLPHAWLSLLELVGKLSWSGANQVLLILKIKQNKKQKNYYKYLEQGFEQKNV